MKKKNKIDAFEMVKTFQNTVLKQAPSFEQMYEEVRMMKFKIKPLQGDVLLLNLNNKEFISALWSLGKLDEFFNKYLADLPPKQQEIFFRLMNELRYEFQSRLNRVNIKSAQELRSAVFELEIFREKNQRFN